MNDLVFVMYNLKLKDRQVKKSIEMDNFEDVSSDDEWIASEGVNCNEGMHEDEDYDREGDFVIVDEAGGEGDDGEGEGEGHDGEGEGDDGHNESMQLEEEQLEEDEDEDEDEDEEEAIQHFDDNEFY